MRKRLLAIALCVATAACMIGLTACQSGQTSTYTPQKKDALVAPPAIGVADTLRVGVDTTNPPMAGQTTRIVGIDVDLAAALADELGLKLEVVDVGSSALTSLQNGTVDLVMGLSSTNTDSAIWKSSAYMQTGTVLFALKQDAPLPGEGSKIAAQSTSMSSWNITSEYGVDALVNASDLASAFQMLAQGEADYVAADAVMGTYAAHAAGVEAHPIGLESASKGYCVGVLNSNGELSNLVSKYIKQLQTTGILSIIENKWLGTDLDISSLALTPAAQKAAEQAAANAAAEEAESKEAEEGASSES